VPGGVGDRLDVDARVGQDRDESAPLLMRVPVGPDAGLTADALEVVADVLTEPRLPGRAAEHEIHVAAVRAEAQPVSRLDRAQRPECLRDLGGQQQLLPGWLATPAA
jgi:hypothetical protein